MKCKLRKTGIENSNVIVWEWFSTKAINLPMLGHWYRNMQNKWLTSWEETNFGLEIFGTRHPIACNEVYGEDNVFE